MSSSRGAFANVSPLAVSLTPGQAAQARQGLCGARIGASSPDTLTLELAGSPFVEVNGELVQFVDAAGVSTIVFDRTTDHTIDAAGADSGAAALASTLYGVYLSNSAASFAPKSLKLGALVPKYSNGLPYLDSAGNAANWRYLGAVFSDAGLQFNDSATAREVVNLYNRVPKLVQVLPGYANDNAQTSFNLNSAVWARIAAGVQDAATYVDLAAIPGFPRQPAPFFLLSIQLANPVGICRFGIGLDSATTPQAACLAPAGAAVSLACSFVPNVEALAATTRHTVYMLGMTSGAACSIVSDVPRNGATFDPSSTRLTGQVWA